MSSLLAPRFSFAQEEPNAELTPAQQGEDDSGFLADANWKPAFLSEQQNETLIALSDAIIPATDTPGAKAALVNRFLDLVLSTESSELQQKFLGSLNYIDGESQRLLGKEFRFLTAEDQNQLLLPLAYSVRGDWFGEDHPEPGIEHFVRLKSLIATAYYTSEIGEKELGWDGSFTHGPFQGCQHAAHTHSAAAPGAAKHTAPTHKK